MKEKIIKASTDTFDLLSQLVVYSILIVIGLFLFIAVVVKFLSFDETNSNFKHVENKQKVNLNKIMTSDMTNNEPKQLLSFRFKQKRNTKNASYYCYTTIFDKADLIDLEKMKSNYKKISNLKVFITEDSDSVMSLADCINTIGTGAEDSLFAPNFSYRNKVLIRGSTNHLSLMQLSTNTPNTEVWIQNEDKRYAMLIAKDKKVVKMVYRYWSCDSVLVCN